MSDRLDKLKKLKAGNKSKEEQLSQGFNVDSTVEPEISSSVSTAEIKEKNPKAAEAKVPEAKKKKETKPKPAAPIEPIKTIDATDSSAASAFPEKNLGLRLASEEDKRYLNMIPLGRGITKKAFFVELMEKEFENADAGMIKISDPELEHFRNSSLQTAPLTISVPEPIISKIKEYSAKHMIKYQRYVAYVIHKARVQDEAWNSLS